MIVNLYRLIFRVRKCLGMTDCLCQIMIQNVTENKTDLIAGYFNITGFILKHAVLQIDR